MYSGSCASIAAILQLENDLIDFSWIKFFTFEHSIYSHACGKLDYYFINYLIKVHFTVIFDSYRATNYSDSFLSWAQSKSFKLASHVAYCVPVLSLKVIGTKVFAFNPFLMELNIDW